MKYAPLFIVGSTQLLFGLFGIAMLEYKEGLEWVPYAQVILGLILITIKLMWVFKHREEYNGKA